MKANVKINESMSRTSTPSRLKKNIMRLFTILLFSLIFITSIVFTTIYFYEKNDKIVLKNEEIKLYIDSADEVSKGKLQVNWKYLAAIDYVRNKKNLSNLNNKSIEELGQLFLGTDSNGNKYKLINLENILDDLSFTKSQKEKANKYLTQLENVGLVPDNLKKDSDTRKFIDEITPKAIELYKSYRILPSVTISQAILESSWGKSELTTKANNLFGIKADSTWKGKSVNMTTSEYYNTVIKDNFRSYESISQSLDDYGKFIADNKRYKESGVFNCTQYIDQTQAIENAGYSTIEDEKGNNIYADLITNLIRENNLQLIDNKVESVN